MIATTKPPKYQEEKRKRLHGWRWVKLGRVCQFTNGNAYRESDWDTEGTPIIRIQNLNDEKKPFNYWSGTLAGRVCVENGDLLLAWSGTPGTSFGAHIWDRGVGVLNQHIFLVQTNGELEKDWAKWAINEALDDLINAAHGAVGLAHVTKREVEALAIPIPPLPEQRRIAGVLREQMVVVNKARAAAQARLEAVKALPAAFLREIFPQPGQSLPVDWCWVKLGEVCKFIGGSQPDKGNFKYEPSSEYVRLVQIQDFRLSDVAVFIPEKMALRTFDVTDVMIGRYGPPVFQILRGLSGAYNVALMKTAPSERLDKDFLYFLLQWPEIQRDVIAQSQRSAGQSGVQKEYLEKYLIPLPPIYQQRQLATQLNEQMTAVSKARIAAEEELNTINALPAALLRRAFNGEI